MIYFKNEDNDEYLQVYGDVICWVERHPEPITRANLLYIGQRHYCIHNGYIYTRETMTPTDFAEYFRNNSMQLVYAKDLAQHARSLFQGL